MEDSFLCKPNGLSRKSGFHEFWVESLYEPQRHDIIYNSDGDAFEVEERRIRSGLLELIVNWKPHHGKFDGEF